MPIAYICHWPRNYIGMAVLLCYVMYPTRFAGVFLVLLAGAQQSCQQGQLLRESRDRCGLRIGRLGQFGPNLGWILKKRRLRHSYIVPCHWPLPFFKKSNTCSSTKLQFLMCPKLLCQIWYYQVKVNLSLICIHGFDKVTLAQPR